MLYLWSTSKQGFYFLIVTQIFELGNTKRPEIHYIKWLKIRFLKTVYVNKR